MALVTILARWYEVRVRMVGENVCPLLVWEAILAVGNHVLWNPLHIIHRTQPAYWILNKEVFGLQFTNQF